MGTSVGTIYLEWSSVRSGVIITGEDGRNRKHVKVTEVPAAVGVNTDAVVVRHIDGPELARTALAAVTVGKARCAEIESDIGHRTVLTGVHLATLNAWSTGGSTDHPASRVLEYGDGDQAALAAIIGNIFDPQWYRDAERPDRHSAVEARLGLTPRWDKYPSPFRDCVTRAWRATKTVNMTDRNFFGRMFLRKIEERGDHRVAERIVGRYFVKCLLAAWRDASRPSGSEPMFDERILFDPAAYAAVRGS